MKDLNLLTSDIISRLKAEGAELAHCSAACGETREFNVDGGEFSLFRTLFDNSLSITAVIGGRKGSVSLNSFEDEAVERAVDLVRGDLVDRTLVADGKCVRLYKPKWFNEAITVPNRDMFGFTRRDECVGFLLLLEFFERESREQGVTADDRDNLRFRFGDWLECAAARFRELFPERREAYSDEKVRIVLRGIMPSLERYRLIRKVRPSADESVNESETIYEALPAMWHYQAAQLAVPIAAADEKGDAVPEERIR